MVHSDVLYISERRYPPPKRREAQGNLPRRACLYERLFHFYPALLPAITRHYMRCTSEMLLGMTSGLGCGRWLAAHAAVAAAAGRVSRSRSAATSLT